MNIFIKFSIIISTLIGLNSAGLNVFIIINKEGLKNEPKIFEGENGIFGQFRLKLAKWSENDHKWEYNPDTKSEVAKSDVRVALDFMEKWRKLYYEKRESFLMAVKVEMDGNKLIQPIPFIFNMNGQTVTIHLKEKENGKIIGISSVPGHGRKRLEKWLKQRKIKQEIDEDHYKPMFPVQQKPKPILPKFSPDLQTNSYKNMQPPAVHFNRPPNTKLVVSSDLPKKLHRNVQSTQPILSPSHQNPMKHSSMDLLTQWHETSQQLLAQQMAVNQIKNMNYFNDARNIHQIPIKNMEIPRRHGKGLMSEISGVEGRAENWQKMGQKLMQSAINASQRQTIPWQGGEQQYLEQNVRKHEIDHELLENRPEKKQKLAPEKWSPIPLHWQEHRQEHGFPTATGNIINHGIGQIDEHGGSQNEFAQFISSGFNRPGNLPKMNADIGGWQQNLHENLPIQTAKMPSSFDTSGHQNYGKTSSNINVAAISEEQHYTSIGHNGKESDLSSIFHDENPSIEQILSESSNSHSWKSE